MNFMDLIPSLRRDAGEPEHLIGTPEQPLEADPLEKVLTGSRASQSARDRYAHATRNGRTVSDDFLLPANSRAARRAGQAAQRRQTKKATRRYRSGQIQQRREANHLAQLFNLTDRLVVGTPIERHRARTAINRRVAAVVQADRIRYDKEIAARQEDRSRPTPRPVVKHEEVWAELRAIAKTAPTVTPKAARRRQALDDFFERELVRDRQRPGLAREIDEATFEQLGRTGRAG